MRSHLRTEKGSVMSERLKCCSGGSCLPSFGHRASCGMVSKATGGRRRLVGWPGGSALCFWLTFIHLFILYVSL